MEYNRCSHETDTGSRQQWRHLGGDFEEGGALPAKAGCGP